MQVEKWSGNQGVRSQHRDCPDVRRAEDGEGRAAQHATSLERLREDLFPTASQQPLRRGWVDDLTAGIYDLHSWSPPRAFWSGCGSEGNRVSRDVLERETDLDQRTARVRRLRHGERQLESVRDNRHTVRA